MSDFSLIFPSALEKTGATALFKIKPGDFIVEEELPFLPTSSGEHVFIFIEKCGQNTAWVARQLSIHACIHKSRVSYAGQKDRHSIARQWFSLHIPGKKSAYEIATTIQNINGVKVIHALRHNKKLQRGVLKRNRFNIVLRNYKGCQKSTEARLKTIQQQGVPNYFGYQRFGTNGRNISAAIAMFEEGKYTNRQERSLLLSSARSLIFNAVLAYRVTNRTWNQWQSGDIVTFPDNQTLIFPDNQDAEVIKRCQQYQLLLTAPLWGEGELKSLGIVKQLESAVAVRYNELCKGLEKAGLRQERRAMQLPVNDLTWQWKNDSLLLAFSLMKGAYATSVLKEVVNYTDASLNGEVLSLVQTDSTT